MADEDVICPSCLTVSSLMATSLRKREIIERFAAGDLRELWETEPRVVLRRPAFFFHLLGVKPCHSP